jgi:hypothetical protein
VNFGSPSGPIVINIDGRKFIAKKYVYIWDLSCNLSSLSMRELSPVNYGTKSINDNIGPWGFKGEMPKRHCNIHNHKNEKTPKHAVVEICVTVCHNIKHLG